MLLRAGGTSSTSSSLSPSHLSSARLFSLAVIPALPRPSATLGPPENYRAACSHDFSGSGSASKFFDSHPSGDLSNLCRLTPCYFGLAFDGTPSGNVGTGGDTASSTTRPLSSRSLQAPLVTASPRRDGGWTHGGAVLDGAPVTAVLVRHGDASPCPLRVFTW